MANSEKLKKLIEEVREEGSSSTIRIFITAFFPDAKLMRESEKKLKPHMFRESQIYENSRFPETQGAPEYAEKRRKPSLVSVSL